jgi:hypothetical protein
MAESHSNCGNCRFFRNQQIMGICRYSPQQQNKHQNDWCGKHEPQIVEVVKLPVYDIMTDETTEVSIPVQKKRGRKPKNANPIA